MAKTFLLHFSLRRTWPQLWDTTPQPGEISCLHGLRFVGLIMVYVQHKIFFVLFNMISNRTDNILVSILWMDISATCPSIRNQSLTDTVSLNYLHIKVGPHSRWKCCTTMLFRYFLNVDELGNCQPTFLPTFSCIHWWWIFSKTFLKTFLVSTMSDDFKIYLVRTYMFWFW